MTYTIANPYGDGTPQERLVFWNAYLAALPMLGQTRIINGRTWIGPDARGALEVIKHLQSEVATSEGPAVNYPTRQRPI